MDYNYDQNIKAIPKQDKQYPFVEEFPKDSVRISYGNS